MIAFIELTTMSGVKETIHLNQIVSFAPFNLDCTTVECTHRALRVRESCADIHRALGLIGAPVIKIGPSHD